MRSLDPPLGYFLWLLKEVFEPEANDALEVNYYSSGCAGVLVYPAVRRPWSSFTYLFQTLGLPPPGITFLEILLSRIPAQTHAVRLLSDGAVSIFFRIDVPAGGVAALTRVFAGDRRESPLPRFFEQLEVPACGVAFQWASCGSYRVRFYHMAQGSAALTRAVETAAATLGVARAPLEELGAVLASLAPPDEPVVVNVGDGARSGPSVKLEFPQICGEALPRILRLSVPERRTWFSAVQLARSLGQETFPYVGARCSARGDREMTFYVDARPLRSRPAR